MSLLSDTRGTPGTIWALVQLLAAHDGELERAGIWGRMDPFDSRGSCGSLKTLRSSCRPVALAVARGPHSGPYPSSPRGRRHGRGAADRPCARAAGLSAGLAASDRPGPSERVLIYSCGAFMASRTSRSESTSM